MKLNVAICDDEMASHDVVDKMLAPYKEKINLMHFLNAKDMLEHVMEFNVILLDIEMPGMDGIEAGRILHERNEKSCIIMLTAKRERFKDGYKIGARRFVTKPIDEEELIEAIDSAIFSFIGMKKVPVRFNSQNLYIEQNLIRTITAKGSFIQIETKDKLYDSNDSLKKYVENLDKQLFVMPTRGVIVNMKYIVNICGNILYMDDETEIKISRRQIKNVTEKIVEYDKKYFY